jgi:RimJ/RimL family protein N-acetyltransferase
MSEIHIDKKTTRLISGDVELRSLLNTDAPRMAELSNNKLISQNLRDGFPHPFTLADAMSFIEKYSTHPAIILLAITYKGEYAGNISLLPGTDVYRKSAEIGYFIGEPFWNKGITTIAVSLIIDYAFSTLGIARIHTGIFEYNLASQRVLEKCGFEKEGIFKKSVFKMGKLWNEIRYAKINPGLDSGL